MSYFKGIIVLGVVAFSLAFSGGAGLAFERLLEEGIREYRQDRYEEAQDYFERARKQAPRSSVAAFYLGLTLKQMGNLREASTNYRDALTLTPPVLDAYTELIEVLLRLEELKEARVWIERARREKVKPGTVSFLEGLVSAREGKGGEAILAFRRAREEDKGLTQSADFQIAMIHAKERRFDKAKESLKAVMALDPGSDLAAFAREYETSLTRMIKAHRTWRPMLSVAYQYDDNVISKPSAAVGNPVVDGLTGERDSSVAAIFGLTYNPLPRGPWGFMAQYQLYTNTYFKTHSHNLVNQTVSLAPSYTTSRAMANVAVSYSHVLVDSRSYLETASVRPALNYQLGPALIGQFSLGLAGRTMLRPVIDPNENRDGQIYSAGAGLVFLTFEGKGMMNVRYEITRDDPKGSNWVNTANRVALSALIPLADKVSLNISGEALIQDYSNIHTLTGPLAPPGFPAAPTKREDKIYSAQAGLKAGLYKDLSLNLNYSHTNAQSNIGVYDYRRNVYSLGLEYAF